MLKMRIKKGFTLVEMLVAMAIFVIFTGVIINSYASIVKSQKEANDFRIMYADARGVFETLVYELRDGMVDYGHYGSVGLTVDANGLSELYLVSKDASKKTKIIYGDSDDAVLISRGPGFADEIKLNTNVAVEDFRFYVSPVIDPYDPQFVNNDKNQFQPKVTIYAKFKEFSGERSFVLQTTVSSRIYNQVYQP